MTLKMSFCLKAATELDPDDLDSITGLIETYTRAGMPVAQAEESAVRDLLAQVAGEREENVGLLALQHADLFKAPPKAKRETSANKVFTEDAAAAARALLKKKLGQLNSGLDPEVVQAGITLAGYHIEKGARSFAAFTAAMLEDLGEVVRPYLKSWYAATYFDPRAAAMQADMTPLDRLDQPEAPAAPEETSDVPSSNTNLEPDSSLAADEAPGVGDDLFGTRPAESTGPVGGRSGSARRGRTFDPGLFAGGAAALRELGDQPVRAGEPGARPEEFPARDSDGARSDDPGIEGVQADPRPAGSLAEAAAERQSDSSKRAAQRAAESVAIAPGIENIRATLPYLEPAQQDDVQKAETRFAKEDGYGMLFTNGTGTGKTFTGLGVIKRSVRAGKGNVLIVVPDDKIKSDWIESGVPMGLTLTSLANTKDAGRGVTITTYANLGDNDQLASREWDMVLADEAHMLMQAADAKDTKALDAVRALTLHPRGVGRRFAMLHAEDIALREEIEKRLDGYSKTRNADGTTEMERADLATKIAALEAKLTPLVAKLNAARKEVDAYVQARQGTKRPRLTALSATPFAYEKTLDWAEGYLFDYAEGMTKQQLEDRSYNAPTPQQYFFITHLGYSMRTGKLNAPDAKVNSGQLQRQVNTFLKKKGSLSGRSLDVPFDYDRRFVLAESAVGNEIDRAIDWVREQDRASRAALKKGEEAPTGFDFLNAEMGEALFGPTGHLTRRYLLEAIKAKEVVRHVKEHMAMGRKVLVFHDFKKGGAINPFNFQDRPEVSSVDPALGKTVETINAQIAAYNAAAAQFRTEFPTLAGDELLADLLSPIERFGRELPATLYINGDEKKSDLLARYKQFNDDANGPMVALVQSDKDKGWSGHDTTGKHQRVLFNLGLPTKPTKTTQQEGRIYRTGQASDAMFRYLNTGTDWEKLAFAQTIATRASAAENLASGEAARALKDGFIAAFEESGDYPAGHEGEGKGGKERDRQANNALTEFDRAKGFYWATQKKNSKTKAKEGADYFATPEPLGLKMTQWLNLRAGEDALEPSGGHGAIARWLPENTTRTAIEPSSSLGARMALVFDGKIIQSTFEDLNVVNKYDGIAMNPPFGTAGRMAVDHVAKAATHLRDGGRIVALIPTGPAADKKFDAWFYEEQQRPRKPVLTHPKLGPIFAGDTVTTAASWAPKGVVAASQNSSGYVMLKLEGRTGATGVTQEAFTSVEPTGKRTETYRPAEGLNLVADIKLPAVTFERAGTGVMTRVVVLEKSDKAPETVKRDLTGVDDINALFDRMENLELPARGDPRQQEEPAPVAAPAPADRPPPPTAAKKAEKQAAKASAVEKLQAANIPMTEHVTGKGKRLVGVVRKDLTLAQAKEVDNFTFKKDGGFFIRAEHLDLMQEKHPLPDVSLDMSGAAIAGTGQVAAASAAEQAEVAKASTRLALRMKDPDLVLAAVAPRDDRQREAAAFVKAVSGRQVIFFKSSKPSFANGFAHPEQPNILFVNVDQQRPIMGLLGHELTHDMRRTESALYDQLVTAIEPLLSNESIHAERLRKMYADRSIDIADDRVREELIADIVGDNWTDPAFWREVTKGRPPLFQRVLRAVRDFLDSVLSKLRNERPFRSEMYVSDIVVARKAVADTMAEFFSQPERTEAAQREPELDIALDLAAAPVQQRERSLWLDATNRVQFAPGAWLVHHFGAEAGGALFGGGLGAAVAGPVGAALGATAGLAVGRNLGRLGLKAASPALTRQLREMKLVVQKAQETAAGVATEANKLTPDERLMVSDIIEGELAAGVTPPTHAVRLAALMNQSMRAQTDELVSLGMLSAESAARWDGKYLPRFYESKLRKTVADAWGDAARRLLGRTPTMQGIKGKHLKGRGMWETIPAADAGAWQALGWEIRDPDFKPGDNEVQVWRDYTRAERDAMGEVRDAGFRFVMGYMQTQRDIALGRMFASMATDPAQSSRLEKPGWVRVPSTVVEGTGVQRYGKLSGRWVPRETMSHLSQIEEASSAAWRMYRKALGLWKEGKVVLNPVSHVNNIVSNLTMAHFAGVGYHRADKYVAAIKDFAWKSPQILEAKGAGLFLGSMSDAELMDALPPELKALATKADSQTVKGARFVYNAMTFFLRKPMGQAYQAEDLFFRYLIWKDARARGLNAQDAVDYAQRYIFTYDDLPKTARYIRDFGVPFFAYTYKAVPALLHTALTHPVRMAAPAALLMAANAASYAIATGDDEDDWWEKLQKYLNDPAVREKARAQEELEREHLPPWMKGFTALATPKAVRMGMDEVTKLPMFLDVSRFIPGGDMFDISPNAGGIAGIPQPITPNHPLLSAFGALVLNKDAFTGKPVFDANDTTGEQAQKQAAWLWKQISPAIAIGNYHWERGMNALAQASGGEVKWIPDAVKPYVPAGEATGIGRDGLPVQPSLAAAQTFGVKLRPFDLAKSERIGESMKAKVMRDVMTELRALKRQNAQGSVSDKQFEREKDKAREKLQRLQAGQDVNGEKR